MTLRSRLLITATAVWLCAMPAPVKAEPISTAIGLTLVLESALGVSAAVAGSIGGTIIGVGLSVAVNLAARLFAPKDSSGAATAQTPTGAQTSLTIGASVPRNAIVGPQATAGQLAYWNLYGDNNRYLQLVFTLGIGPHDALTGIIVNGTRCTFGAQEGGTGGYTAYRPVTEFDKDGTHHLLVRFFHGFYDQAVDQDLVDYANPPGRWPAGNRGRGVCYVSLTLDYLHPELWPQGVPSFLFELQGLRLYDRRKDSTNGGSGAHRWSDQHTWEYSENPALGLYLFERGLYVGTHKQIGRGLAPVDLLSDLFVAAANIADEDVALAAGGTEKRYRIGMNVGADRDWSGVEHDFCTAMAGWLMESAGAYGPIAGAAQSPAFSFTDDDLIAGRQISYSQKRSRSELVNAIFGSYPDPAQNWQSIPYPARASSADETIDGGEFAAQRDYPMLPFAMQVQRIGEIERRLGRHQATAGVTLGFRFSNIEQGDWGTWTSAALGFTTTFLVSRVVVEDDDSTTLSLREISADVFDFDEDVDTLDPLDPGDLPGINDLVTSVPDFAVEQLQIAGSGGLTIPALHALWSPILDRTVDTVKVRYRIVGTTDEKVSPAFVPSDGEGIISDGIQAGTPYEASAGITTTPIRETFWTDWVPVTAPAHHVVPTATNVTAGGVDMAAFQAQIAAKVNAVPQALAAALASIAMLSDVPSVLGQPPALAAVIAGAPALENLPSIAALYTQSVNDRIEQISDVAIGLLLQQQQTDDLLRDAGITIDRAAGRVTIWALNSFKDEITTYKSSVTANFDAVNAAITLRATFTNVTDQITAASLGYVPAAAYEFNGTVEGWTGTNATLTPGTTTMSAAITAADGYAKTPAISFAAASNTIVQIAVRRTAGTGWGLKLLWGSTLQNSLAFDTPADPTAWNTLVLTMSGIGTWTGTLTQLAVTGNNGATFEIDRFSVGASQFAALALSGMDARVSVVESSLNAINGTITNLATNAQFNTLSGTVTTVSNTLDSLSGTVATKADTATVTALSTTLTSVQHSLDSLNGVILSQIDLVIDRPQESDLADAVIGALLEGQADRDRLAIAIGHAQQILSVKVDDQGAVISQSILTLSGQVNDNQASLVVNYYTKVAADSAIAAAISTFNSTTIVPNYTNTATLTSTYYTKTATDSAIAAQIVEYDANTIQALYESKAHLTTNYYTATSTDSAIAAQIATFYSSTIQANYTNTATLNSNFYTKTDADTAISAAITAFNTNTIQALYTNTADLNLNYYTKTATDSAISVVASRLTAISGPSGVVTISIASPAVITRAGHNLSNAYPIVLATTGALPTGLTTGVTYYIVGATTDTFQLAATVGGSAINTSGTQSGVHSVILLGGTLSSYVTTATLTTNYYTKTDANTAITAAITTYDSSTVAANYVTSANLTTNYYTKTAADSAISAAISSYSVTVNGTTATISNVVSALYDTNGITLQWGIVATTSGAPAGAVIFQSLRKLDGSVTKNLIIDANVSIHGDVIGTGTLTFAKMDATDVRTGVLTAGSVSSTQVGTNLLITNQANIGNLVVKTIHIDDAQVTDSRISSMGVHQLMNGSFITLLSFTISVTAPNGSTVNVFLFGDVRMHNQGTGLNAASSRLAFTNPSSATSTHDHSFIPPVGGDWQDSIHHVFQYTANGSSQNISVALQANGPNSNYDVIDGSFGVLVCKR